VIVVEVVRGVSRASKSNQRPSRNLATPSGFVSTRVCGVASILISMGSHDDSDVNKNLVGKSALNQR